MRNWTGRLRRLVYLLHRWTGVAACMLMALWFVSGMVMLFVGYPKLTPWERLAAQPALPTQQCCVGLPVALEAARMQAGELRESVLTSVAGRPVYRLQDGTNRIAMVDAVSAQAIDVIDRNRILASVQAFLPHAQANYLGMVDEDRWAHSRALNRHRPLHLVQMQDAERTLLYLSSHTGEVVLDAPQAQRYWNVVGAWLHWLYLLRDQPKDPVWEWIVIALSAIATLTAVTGTIAGIWRWRFSGRYRSGSHSPYREPMLHWHHVLGLSFAAIVATWVFSGLMSMNPFGMFDAQGQRPDTASYRGADSSALPHAPSASMALARLSGAGFDAVELEWKSLDGRPYLLARNAANQTRLVMATAENQALVETRWDEHSLLAAGKRLLKAPLSSHTVLMQYDTYYYARQPEAMSGAAERRLPVMRLYFGDEGATWVHLDPATGDIASSLDRRQRVGRWLFNFLHSWDLPVMLQAGWVREALLLVLSLGGLALSTTGVVLASGRIRKWAAALARRRQRD